MSVLEHKIDVETIAELRYLTERNLIHVMAWAFRDSHLDPVGSLMSVYAKGTDGLVLIEESGGSPNIQRLSKDVLDIVLRDSKYVEQRADFAARSYFEIHENAPKRPAALSHVVRLGPKDSPIGAFGMQSISPDCMQRLLTARISMDRNAEYVCDAITRYVKHCGPDPIHKILSLRP